MRDRIVEIGEMKENKDVNKKEGERMINERRDMIEEMRGERKDNRGMK